ncbi:MAG: hypothetical protein IJY47_00955 [Clostridia bacterium]|nr:hypothetical protein [Clostridia bacterium]
MKKAYTAIVGNEALRERLMHDVLEGTLPHAVILEGPRGSGRHTVARLTAAALLCHCANDPALPLPCMTCPGCRKVLEGKSPDVIPLGCDGKATIGVESVRFLREDVHVIPNDSDHKIYIIEDADRMTPQAQNALLLTLEEPPVYARFFLLCENAGILLETIRSRAPILRTERLPREQVDCYLCEHDRRAAQMKLADPKGYEELLTAAGNGIGQALEYLDPKVFQPVRQLRALASDFVFTAIKHPSSKTILPLLSRFSTKRDLLRDQLSAVSDALRDLILLKKSDEAPLSFYADRTEAIELCDGASLPTLYQLNEAVRSAIDENARNANVRLCLIKLLVSAELI